MNALAPFAPILVLSVGSLGYLLGGRWLDAMKASALFAVLLIAGAIWCASGLVDSSAAAPYGIAVNAGSKLLALVACVAGLVSIVATSGALEREKISMVSEYYYLMVTSLCGALIMIFAADFLTLFIGVEVASLALYCLCASRVNESRSSEAAMKYFLLGCFSSGFLLYGIALWYGATGSLAFASADVSGSSAPIIALSFLMVLVGITFKIGLAPFHFWVPDVYQGAPTSVTTFMSCIVKVAAVATLIRVCVTTFGFTELWAVGPLWLISILAMTMGNLSALRQSSVKRMLAYSSVAQAGYMLIGIVVAGASVESLGATIYYLISYCAMTIGAFATLSALGPDVDDIRDLRGLGKRSPFLATCMTLFFLALAGLPPGLAGLMGKVYLFSSALSAEFYGLAIIAALNSALACAYYFRVPVAMFFQDEGGAAGDSAATSRGEIKVAPEAGLAIALCAAAVVLFGLFPEPLLRLVRSAALGMGKI
jgi:NADH-quinone oxidoreductase subunit N